MNEFRSQKSSEPGEYQRSREKPGDLEDKILGWHQSGRESPVLSWISRSVFSSGGFPQG